MVGRGTNADEPAGSSNLHAQACISRARPDVISGLVYHQFFRDNDPVAISWYATIDMWSSFEAVLPDHAGVLATTPGEHPFATDPSLDTLADDVRAFHWEYRGVTYDEAWPWDEITDDAVREAVYERYLPVNALP